MIRQNSMKNDERAQTAELSSAVPISRVMNVVPADGHTVVLRLI